MTPAGGGRAAALIQALDLQAHPEGGHYAEFFRSAQVVDPTDGGDGREGRSSRAALTSIDFVLAAGQFSAWHRVCSDEAWHLLEGEGLRLWLVPPDLSGFSAVDLGPVGAGRRPRHVVPARWWQAAVPLGAYAYVGATVGPGFDFADFSFGRDDAALCAAMQAQAPALRAWL